ncbi:MAG: hypothetical protein M3404_13425 [Actinomycetota bacterium]|nr:hypothetical protein [Actinomycetota bacterium]
MARRAGHWSIRPGTEFDVRRRYLPGSLVLETAPVVLEYRPPPPSSRAPVAVHERRQQVWCAVEGIGHDPAPQQLGDGALQGRSVSPHPVEGDLSVGSTRNRVGHAAAVVMVDRPRQVVDEKGPRQLLLGLVLHGPGELLLQGGIPMSEPTWVGLVDEDIEELHLVAVRPVELLERRQLRRS